LFGFEWLSSQKLYFGKEKEDYTLLICACRSCWICCRESHRRWFVTSYRNVKWCFQLNTFL